MQQPSMIYACSLPSGCPRTSPANSRSDPHDKKHASNSAIANTIGYCRIEILNTQCLYVTMHRARSRTVVYERSLRFYTLIIAGILRARRVSACRRGYEVGMRTHCGFEECARVTSESRATVKRPRKSINNKQI